MIKLVLAVFKLLLAGMFLLLVGALLFASRKNWRIGRPAMVTRRAAQEKTTE